jgi:2-C-methyl-D-erythritol 2,4-cyclodiphosphate synthase
MRIGHGYDVHGFGDGNHIVLGGITIPFTQGLIAHSDGDVVLHALCDALLGACALGDIGKHFPDNDARYANIDSRELLREVYKLVQLEAYRLVNTDITIVAQAPKMAPYIEAMCRCIAADLSVELNAVNIKATTTEGLGFIGRSEGIAVHAVVLLQTISE